MENKKPVMNETRIPLKKNSFILGILFLIIGIAGLFIDKEDFIFSCLLGLYFMFDALKDRLMTRIGQKNIKIMEYILGGILIMGVAFSLYQRFIK